MTRAQRDYAAEKRDADAQPREKMAAKMNVMVYSGTFPFDDGMRAPLDSTC